MNSDIENQTEKAFWLVDSVAKTQCIWVKMLLLKILPVFVLVVGRTRAQDDSLAGSFLSGMQALFVINTKKFTRSTYVGDAFHISI